MLNLNQESTLASLINNSVLPHLETEMLLASILNKERTFILSHPKNKLDHKQLKKLNKLITKRLENWPIAYLIKEKEFYELKFKVNNKVLVPRPETEMIVDEIKELYKDIKSKTEPLIIDLGTGSGAIMISLAQEIKDTWPQRFIKTDFKAMDISKSALNIAQYNARKYKLKTKIKFYQGNLLNTIKLKRQNLNKRPLIISANLPYLTPKQIETSPSIKQEPRLALVAGSDGLKYYYKLWEQLSSLDFKKTKEIYLFCEIDPQQKTLIQNSLKKYLPRCQFSFQADLNRKIRLLKIRIN